MPSSCGKKRRKRRKLGRKGQRDHYSFSQQTGLERQKKERKRDLERETGERGGKEKPAEIKERPRERESAQISRKTVKGKTSKQ